MSRISLSPEPLISCTDLYCIFDALTSEFTSIYNIFFFRFQAHLGLGFYTSFVQYYSLICRPSDHTLTTRPPHLLDYALTSGIHALTAIFHALISVFRALSSKFRALASKFRAPTFIFRALHHILCTGLSISCIDLYNLCTDIHVFHALATKFSCIGTLLYILFPDGHFLFTIPHAGL